jgi:hypothetical protein
MTARRLEHLCRLVLILGFCGAMNLNAATVSTDCRYLDNNRSIIVVKVSGLRGYYYARVYSYSLEQWVFSRPKAANANGLVRFDFDSLKRPGSTLIPANFNKSGKAGGTIRKYKTNTLMGGITSSCLLR